MPDLPKPPVFSGSNQDNVEDKLFVFDNYLIGSNIPKEKWTNYIMPLLADKALTAWTAVAMPLTNVGMPLSWDLFHSTMLTSFAHPDRQYKARELLHKITQGASQSVTHSCTVRVPEGLVRVPVPFVPVLVPVRGTAAPGAGGGEGVRDPTGPCWGLK